MNFQITINKLALQKMSIIKLKMKFNTKNNILIDNKMKFQYKIEFKKIVTKPIAMKEHHLNKNTKFKKNKNLKIKTKFHLTKVVFKTPKKLVGNQIILV